MSKPSDNANDKPRYSTFSTNIPIDQFYKLDDDLRLSAQHYSNEFYLVAMASALQMATYGSAMLKSIQTLGRSPHHYLGIFAAISASLFAFAACSGDLDGGCANDFECKDNRICDAETLRCVSGPDSGSGGAGQGSTTGAGGGGMVVAMPVDLGDGWSSINLGASEALGGYATRSGDVFQLFGGGGDIWGTSDNGQLVYQEVSGDFDFDITVGAFQLRGGIPDTAKLVLMFKERGDDETAPSGASAGVFQSLNWQFGDYWYHRPMAGADVVFDAETNDLNGTTTRLRITRVGNTFSTYSRDQANTMWVKHNDDQELALAPSGFLGFAASSTTSNDLLQVEVTLGDAAMGN